MKGVQWIKTVQNARKMYESENKPAYQWKGGFGDYFKTNLNSKSAAKLPKTRAIRSERL